MTSGGQWQPICKPASGLVRPVPVDPHGRSGPTRGQAAGSGWRQTSRGLYVPAEVEGSVPEQRILEQSVRLPPGGAVTGWASLRMHLAAFFDGRAFGSDEQLPVPLAVGSGGGPRSDEAAALSREPLEPEEIVVVQGIPCTVVPRALFDEMRRPEDWRESVVAMDMTAAAGLVSIGQMLEYCGSHRRWRRARQVTRALGHASERSRSPNEVRSRLIWEIDAVLPRPLVNAPIFTRDAKFVAIADLLDPVAGVVGEYDGSDHLRISRRSKDIGREESLRGLGLEYFTLMRPDLDDRAATAERMKATRARARFETEANRRWTIQPPRGWTEPGNLQDELFINRLLQEERMPVRPVLRGPGVG